MFVKLGVLFLGALITRALLSGVHIRAHDFPKLPFEVGGVFDRLVMPATSKKLTLPWERCHMLPLYCMPIFGSTTARLLK